MVVMNQVVFIMVIVVGMMMVVMGIMGQQCDNVDNLNLSY